MKSILAVLLILFTVEASAQDVSAVPTRPYYVDSLKTTRDTVDIHVSDIYFADYQTLTIKTSTGTDTVNVYVSTPGAGTLTQRGLINLATGELVTRVIATTTLKEYALIGPNINYVRITSTDSVKNTNFTLGSRKGSLVVGGSSDVRLDTLIANQFVPGGPGTATDSVRGKYDAIPYAQNDAKQDSTAKWMVFNIGATQGVITNVYMSADTANATNNTRKLILVADTSGWGNLALDNAAFTVSPAQAQKIIGEPFTVALRTYGTGSTSASGGIQSYQWFVTSSGKLFGLLVMDAAYTGKKRETSVVKLSFEKFE